MLKFLANCAATSALVLAAVCPLVISAQTQWSVGYWEGGYGEPPSGSIQWAALTHFVYWNVVSPTIDGSGNYAGLAFTCFNTAPCSESEFATEQKTFAATAHANGVKVIFEIPQIPGSTYSSVIKSNLSGFVRDFANVTTDSNYDGVSFDWEQNIDFGQVRQLVTALRSALPNGKILTATGFDTEQWISGWSQGSPATYTYLDRYCDMTYDWIGTWEPVSWFNSALHGDGSCGSVGCARWDASKNNFAKAGWDLSRINFGIPFYGYKVSGVSGVRVSSTRYSANQVTYADLLKNYASMMSSATFDSVAHEPWFGISNGYVTYDGPQAVTDKVDYVKSNGLGGWFMFSLNKDYVPSQSPQHPLLAAVAAAMGGGSGGTTAPSISSTSPLASGVIGAPYSLTLNSSGSTPLVWAITSGNLPSGLSLDSSSGVISGTPNTIGTSSFTLEASNAAGNSSAPFSLTVNAKSTASWFNLISKNSGLCLDVTGISTSQNVQLQQWTCWGGDNQKFQFTPVQGGYKITAKNSGLQLNVRGGTNATQNGAAVIQWPYSGASNEIWNTSPNVDGSYSITVLSSGSCADVTGRSMSNGAKIQQWQCTGAANQKWTLVPVQ